LPVADIPLTGGIPLALQKAISVALVGITAPSAQTGAVPVGVYLFDAPPDNAAWPLIVLEKHEIDLRESALDGPQLVHTVELAVWSQYRGSRQVLAILDGIYLRIHDARLPLEAGEIVACSVESLASERADDGRTYQGTAVVKAITG
jgi:hypothetical protein